VRCKKIAAKRTGFYTNKFFVVIAPCHTLAVNGFGNDPLKRNAPDQFSDLGRKALPAESIPEKGFESVPRFIVFVNRVWFLAILFEPIPHMDAC